MKELKCQFAGVVARVESLRGQMGESARQVEGLFESLLAESFHTTPSSNSVIRRFRCERLRILENMP